MGLGVSPLTPDVLRAWCGSRIPAVEPSLSVSFQFSERPRPPLFPPFYPAYSSVFERHSPMKANSFPRQFCCINIYKSRFFARRKQDRATWFFSPLKGTGVPRPQPEPSLPPARFGPNSGVPITLSGHALFTPTLFFCSLPSCGEKGAKAKRKHPGRISRGGFPERGGGRPRSGVGRQGWARGLRGNRVAGGPRRAPGSCRELHRSSSLGKSHRV